VLKLAQLAKAPCLAPRGVDVQLVILHNSMEKFIDILR
jgi:hypothetical protein